MDSNDSEKAKLHLSENQPYLTEFNNSVAEGVKNKKESTTILPQTTKEEIIAKAKQFGTILNVNDLQGNKYEVPVVHINDIPNFHSFAHNTNFGKSGSTKPISDNIFLFEEAFSIPQDTKVISAMYIGKKALGSRVPDLLLNIPNNKQHHFATADFYSIARQTYDLGMEFDYTRQAGHIVVENSARRGDLGYFNSKFAKAQPYYREYGKYDKESDRYDSKHDEYAKAMEKVTNELGDQIMTEQKRREGLKLIPKEEGFPQFEPQYFTMESKASISSFYNEAIVSEPSLSGFLEEKIPNQNTLLKAGELGIPIVIYGEKTR